MRRRSASPPDGGSPSILNSPFARRLLLLFLLSALAPVFLLGALSTHHFQRQLDAVHERHAQHLVKAAGLNVFDWLLQRDRELKAVMAALQRGEIAATSALNGVSITVSPLTTTHFDAAELAALRAGRSVFVRETRASAVVFRLSRLVATAGRDWVVSSTARALPSAHTVLPPTIDYCYFDVTGHAIQCSTSPPQSVVQALDRHPGAGYRHFEVEDGARMRHVRSWRVFLGAEFGLEDWTIAVWHDERDLLISLEGFDSMMRATLTLGGLSAVLLAIVAIRRHLRPFRVLTEAAERIGPARLDVHVELATGDELEQLGKAFNGMAARLRHNAGFQATLAAIDRHALDSHDPVRTGTTLLRGLGALLPFDWACLWCHDGSANQLLMIMQDASDATPRTQGMRALGAAEQARLLCLDGWCEVPVELTAARTADGRAVETVYAVPVDVDGRAAAALWVAPPRGRTYTADDEHSLRELAARFGVALVSFAAREELFREAHFDTLTGLPNRRFFRDMLETALARPAHEAQGIGLLFVDLDDFKYVNDSLGHVTGDRVLKAVANALKRTVRDSDVVARLGGDEFVIVINPLPMDEAAASPQVVMTAEKVLTELRKPVLLDGQELLVRASLGGALYPRDGATTDELLRAADAAMYSTKDAARGGFTFFSQEMNAKATRRLALQAEIARGVEREEFILHYQPQVSTTDGSVVGCEALLRWQHPTRGLLGPGEFLAEAEATGLIGEIGASVLRRAARQLATWHELGFTGLSMSVNVSARQFDDPHLVTMVANLIEDVAIPASMLELEITESVACRRLDHTVEIMSQLSALGVRLAIDDFGTGHSSLSYLQRMPLHTLKVDRSFVIEIGVSKRGESIVDAVLALGKCLSLDIVAEGVETPAQYAYLAERGCDLIQGWLYRPALPALKFLEYVIERRAFARDNAAKALPPVLRVTAD